jgi:hypothetical protein
MIQKRDQVIRSGRPALSSGGKPAGNVPRCGLATCPYPPHFRGHVPWGELKGNAMRKLLAVVVIAGLLISLKANAQERAGSAALGAVSGAIVLGPVGAVAGAFIGYSAGPAIARSWGIGRSAQRSRARQAAQAGDVGAQEPVAANPPPIIRAPVKLAARAAPPASTMPPARAAQTTGSVRTAPPVQGFD